eukprot:CAMPEP_0176284648 /NCGR_PEP_ID=MMETSP0121_2-20121125/51959_1 /TAXON_ID=160619 /ORGANISM="Kryptoperidinium foliaceum, Strain CCMP 1326" /LENGTH=212 /DNA_ID=CAMNT_0017625101 /DNA_START=206 /DNA_END=840 /DNA_ORIENTATION=-
MKQSVNKAEQAPRASRGAATVALALAWRAVALRRSLASKRKEAYARLSPRAERSVYFGRGCAGRTGYDFLSSGFTKQSKPDASGVAFCLLTCAYNFGRKEILATVRTVGRGRCHGHADHRPASRHAVGGEAGRRRQTAILGDRCPAMAQQCLPHELKLAPNEAPSASHHIYGHPTSVAEHHVQAIDDECPRPLRWGAASVDTAQRHHRRPDA